MSVAEEAVALVVYRVGRELSSLTAALEGLDALVFSAVSERTRRRFAHASAAGPLGSDWSSMKRPTSVVVRASHSPTALSQRGSLRPMSNESSPTTHVAF